MNIDLRVGDSLEVLKDLPENSVDSVVTDPPYGLSFMGAKWDYDVPTVELWQQVYRVLKPGGHLLSFAGTRTQHRMAVNIEDAGFEIRDMISWIYGSGFPKSHNIGKSVDKKLGNTREAVGINKNVRGSDVQKGTIFQGGFAEDGNITKGTTDWEGYGTALKPACEPITVARKPLSEKTIADNVIKYGTGGINIDGCRVDSIDENRRTSAGFAANSEIYHNNEKYKINTFETTEPQGRFPANVIFDEEAGKQLDEQSGTGKSGKWKGVGITDSNIYGNPAISSEFNTVRGYEDTGGASRFFYCPKASKTDRNEGLDDFEVKTTAHGTFDKCGKCGKYLKGQLACKCEEPDRIHISSKNNHPTVKPTKLMQYLVRLVTPKGGTVLDPFNGSGSTGKACALEGFNYIGIDLDSDYIEISKARIETVMPKESKWFK